MTKLGTYKSDEDIPVMDLSLAAALVGTTGTPPSASNKFVTDLDPRNTNARVPTVHAHTEGDITGLMTDLNGKAPAVHSHSESDVTNLATDLSNKVPITRTVAGKALTADVTLAKGDVGLGNVDNTSDANKPISALQQTALDLKVPTTRTVAGKALNADIILAKGDVGLGNVDNTSDAAKPISTAEQTALNLKANLAGPTFTGVPAAPTAGAGTNTTQLATTAFAQSLSPAASYRTILDCSGSHTAAKAAGTYGMGQGDPLAVTGIGTLYPLNSIYINSVDYPMVDGKAAKLRIRAQLYTNDVAPTGNFTIGLHTITRPATSGGAGLCIYTIGAAVAGSTCVFTTPAADGLLSAVGADFALPANGHYIIGVVTTATVAASAHVHINAMLQIRNA
jgi:hypothetical protein